MGVGVELLNGKKIGGEPPGENGFILRGKRKGAKTDK